MKNMMLVSSRVGAAVFGMIAVSICSPMTRASSSYEVQVGYADNLRPSPFFPIPWSGGANVETFAGGGVNFDAGAVRIINTGATPITFNSMTIDGFGDGAVYNLWGGWAGTTINPGKSMILTQTGEFNFDSSDDQGGGSSSAQPVVHLKIDGTLQDLTDTAQVLNTEGTDFLAQHNLNESHQWRDIGTFGGQAGSVPDGGSSLALIGIGVAGLLGFRRRAVK